MANNQNDSTEESFYGELDKKKAHQSCCTCQTLSILFLFGLVIVIGGVFYIYWQITREKVFSFKLPSVATLANTTNRLNNIIPDQNGELQISLNDGEVTALLADGLSWQTFIIKELNAQVLPGQMLIYGQMMKPLKSKVVISGVPKVKGGRLDFEVTGLTAGNFNFPKFANPAIGESVTNLFNTKLAPVYQKFNLTEINLENNNMIIKGRKK